MAGYDVMTRLDRAVAVRHGPTGSVGTTQTPLSQKREFDRR